MKEQIKRMKISKEILGKQDIQLLDVRANYEWKDTGIINGSKLVSIFNDDGLLNENFIKEVNENNFDKEKPVYVVCHAGFRSLEAASILKRCGFKDVISLDGGVSALMNLGYKMNEFKG